MFVSYAAKDSEVAKELQRALQRKGLDCFLAEKDLTAGKVWREEIRDALHLSRVFVLLLTPNSVTSKWAMCEAGAFWALRRPIVPAYMFVNIGDVPEIISEYQCRRIESYSDRTDFVREVYSLCRG